MKTRSIGSSRGQSHIDGGYAWVVLVATFLTQAVAIGSTYCASIYIVEWMLAFSANQATVSWIGSVHMAIAFGSAPVSCSLSNYFGHRAVVMTGGVVTAVGYLGTAFATNLTTLCVTYGVIAGFGTCLVYCPATIFIGYYFDKRRSLAMCLSSVGGCTGIMVLSPLFRGLIRHYGWRGACLLTGGIALQVTWLGALFIPTSFWNLRKYGKTDSKLPKEGTTEKAAILDITLFKDYKIILLVISYTLWTMGTVIFFIFIADFCIQHGMTKDFAAYVISASAFSSLGCRLLLSLTSVCLPHMPGLEIYSLFCFFCGIALVLLLINNQVMYISIMCCVIHAFYGGIVAMLGLSTIQVFGMDRATSAYGYLNIGCGIGAFMGPPIAGRLFLQTKSYQAPFYFAGVAIASSALMGIIIIIKKCAGKLCWNEENVTGSDMPILEKRV